jgi:MATE family multidrug resistance protein
MATQFFIMAMGFVDTAMAGRYSAADLAGVALGGNVLWPVFLLMSGITMALTPMVAQLHGAGRVAESGALVRQGLWVALAAAAVAVTAVLNAEPVFLLAGIDPGAADIAQRYLAATAWGIPAALLYVSLRHASEGLGQTLPPMIIVATALPLNAALNWALIYGKFGLPELGGEGCGWATAAVWWFELALMALLLRLPYFRGTGLTDRFDLPDRQQIGEMLRIGVPIGLTVFLEMAVYSVIGFLIGAMGVVPLAAHSIAGNVNWATYVIPMSLGSAASIRIGFLVGGRRFEEARLVVRTAVLLSLAYAVLVSLGLLAAREEIVSIYTSDPAVAAMAANLLLFIALYQLLDDTQATMAGALRGYKDTRMPMVYSLVGYWLLAVPAGTALGYGAAGLDPLGVYGFWAGMTLGLAVVAVCLALRLRRTSGGEPHVAGLAA